jgi:hypothetical protein
MTLADATAVFVAMRQSGVSLSQALATGNRLVEAGLLESISIEKKEDGIHLNIEAIGTVEDVEFTVSAPAPDGSKP